MTDGNPPPLWRRIVQGVAIVYGISFVAGLVFAFNGITPQTDHVVYPILALLAGAVGVAVALRVAETTHLSYLVAMGVGVWLLSLTSVLVGAQSFTGWLNSGTFVAMTVVLGRLMVGSSLDAVHTDDHAYSRTSTKYASTVQSRRA